MAFRMREFFACLFGLVGCFDGWCCFYGSRGSLVQLLEDVMKKVIIVLLLAFSVGCSGGVYSDLLEADMRVASPVLGLGSDMPVVYPAAPVRGYSDPMVQAFGPSWESVEQDYPAYNFNP